MGRERDAVGDRHPPDLQRAEEVRELHGLATSLTGRLTGMARGRQARRRQCSRVDRRAQALRVRKARGLGEEVGDRRAAPVADREAVAPAAGLHLERPGTRSNTGDDAKMAESGSSVTLPA